MGKIYLEHVINNKLHRRYYFAKKFWQKVRSMEVIWATAKLKESRALLRIIGEPVVCLNRQIKICDLYYSDICLSMTGRDQLR